jgi:hypothetical protein
MKKIGKPAGDRTCPTCGHRMEVPKSCADRIAERVMAVRELRSRGMTMRQIAEATGRPLSQVHADVHRGEDGKN